MGFQLATFRCLEDRLLQEPFYFATGVPSNAFQQNYTNCTNFKFHTALVFVQDNQDRETISSSEVISVGLTSHGLVNAT